jgi:hypothetical protein
VPRLQGILTRRVCSHGHDLMGENRYINGKCRLCYKEYLKASYLRKKEKLSKISLDKPSSDGL